MYGESVFRDVLSGDYWRIISPIFLHFGPTHIIFNAIFLWYLGSMIETHSGFLSLLVLVVLIALISNTAQALVTDFYVVFGGMSGVVFGLLSYVWMAQKVGKVQAYRLSDPLFFFMTGYMLLSTFGLFDWLAGGDVADTAHISGYIAGIIFALASHVLTRTSNNEPRRPN